MDLVYCQGAVEQTLKKRDESQALLHQTEVMAEVGQKSDADVAQMRATLAADEYELTHMQSQTTKAMLALKQLMNYPADSTALTILQPTFARATAYRHPIANSSICSYQATPEFLKHNKE